MINTVAGATRQLMDDSIVCLVGRVLPNACCGQRLGKELGAGWTSERRVLRVPMLASSMSASVRQSEKSVSLVCRLGAQSSGAAEAAASHLKIKELLENMDLKALVVRV
jgi:hypothetical protein